MSDELSVTKKIFLNVYISDLLTEGKHKTDILEKNRGASWEKKKKGKSEIDLPNKTELLC